MNIARTFSKLGALLLGALALAAAGCEHKEAKAVATPPPAVAVSQPVERMVTDYQVFTARTEAVQLVDLKPRITGYLTNILFKDGAEVKEGDVLFEIDDRPYKAALEQAKGALEYAQASLVKTQADYNINLALKKDNVGAVSQEDLNKSMGSRDEAKANIEQAKGSLEKAQLNYNWCKVRAPITGRANKHNIDVGGLASADVTILTNIVSIKPIWAYFDVDENSARRYELLVQKGVVKSFRTSDIPVTMGYSGESDFPVKGATNFVSNQVDPNTGSIRLRAVFPNENGALIAGMFGRIRVPTSAAHQALLVVDSAIGTNQGQRFVLVVNDKNEVEYHAVDVGQIHQGLREVMRFRTVMESDAQGQDVTKQVEVLKETDRVIVDGLQRVRPGVKVDPRTVDLVTLLPVPATK